MKCLLWVQALMCCILSLALPEVLQAATPTTLDSLPTITVRPWDHATPILPGLSGASEQPTDIPAEIVTQTITPTLEPSRPGFKVFTHSNGLFSFEYPQEWFVHEDRVVVLSPSETVSKDASTLSASPTLVILPGEQAATVGQPPSQALKFWVESLKYNWESPTVTVDWEARIGGTPAGAAFISGVDRKSGLAFRLYLAVFDLSTRRWLAIAIAPQAEWDRAWPLMQHALLSLHGTEIAPSPGPVKMALAAREPQLNLPLRQSSKVTPQSVAVSSNGWVYVLDTTNDRVQVYDGNGTLLRAFGAHGMGPGLFNFSRQGAIAVGLNGDVYVVDRGNQRIQVFDGKGAFKTTFGEDKLRSPQGVAVDSTGRVYVTDDATRKVTVFEPTGQFVTEFTYQLQPGQISAPKGIAIGPKDHLYIADPVAQSIVVLDREGKLTRAIGSGDAATGYLEWPIAVAVDADGNIFVADSELGAVREFDLQGQPARTFAMEGGKRLNPSSVALDGNDGLFVCDPEAGRLLKYTLTGEEAAVEPGLVVPNGDFAQGLAHWQKWIDAPSIEAASVEVLPGAGGTLAALEMKHSSRFGASGGAGVIQALNLHISEHKALYLTAKVMVLVEEGDNIAGVHPDAKPEGAVILRVKYRDKAGREGEWYHGFYSRSIRGSDLLHFTTVPLEEWYQYNSENLLAEIPDMATVVQLQIYCYGRNVNGRVAEVQFTTSTKT